MPPLPQSAELPEKPSPILIIGAGGIVKDAHLPAYQLAGFPVWALCDRVPGRAEDLAAAFPIKRVFLDPDEAIAAAPEEVIFDLALPASAFPEMLQKLPPGAHVLLQKPMGETMAQANEILTICQKRKLRAAVNTQLRWAPYVIAARHLIDRGEIGEVLNMEIRLQVSTPWQLFPFLEGRPRVEMVYHSIHYVDLVRSFLGDPIGVQARSWPHPHLPRLTSVGSNLLLHYPGAQRAVISDNHMHIYGPRHQESYILWEGTQGAIRAQVGVMLNYPGGAPDRLEICRLKPDGPPEWEYLPIEGSWFPHGFIGSMAQVMRAREGATPEMPSSVEDVIKSMACIEAAYAAESAGGVSPQDFLSPAS